MKRTFVHCAEIKLEPDAESAPGGAVTQALCGSWDHAGPCRWPHLTTGEWAEQPGKVRVLFVAEEKEENQVRAFIEQALAHGECIGPDGKLSRWTAKQQGSGILSESEQAWGVEYGVIQHKTII